MFNRKMIISMLCCLTTLNVSAEKADREKPIEIAADSGMLDQLKGITIWRGNVVVVQGTLIVHADEVTVTRDTQGNQTLVALGNPVKFRQKLDNKDEYIDGEGKRVDYTTINNLAVLTGNAQVRRGGDLVVGHVITYNTATEVYEAKSGPTAGGPNRGRVTVILQPETTGKKK